MKYLNWPYVPIYTLGTYGGVIKSEKEQMGGRYISTYCEKMSSAHLLILNKTPVISYAQNRQIIISINSISRF